MVDMEKYKALKTRQPIVHEYLLTQADILYRYLTNPKEKSIYDVSQHRRVLRMLENAGLIKGFDTPERDVKQLLELFKDESAA